jgi:hypothetical protein
MFQQKRIKMLYEEVHLFNAKILEDTISLEDNIYKSNQCDLIINQNREFREKFKTIMNKAPTRGFENLLFVVLNSHQIYNIKLYRNYAIESLIWSKKQMIDFFANLFDEDIADEESKIEYNNLLSTIDQLEQDSYRVHRQTGKTIRANIKDNNYHDIVERMTIKAKSGLILPMDSIVNIEENRPRKKRSDKLEVLKTLSFQDKIIYLMKNR